MRSALWLAVALAMLAVLGCDSGEEKEKQSALKLTVDQRLPQDGVKLAEGKLHTMSVTVENVSDRTALLLELSTDCDLDRPVSWQTSRYGSVSPSADGMSYTHDELVQQASMPVFNEGLLWPGETLTREIIVRPFGAARKFRVTYVSMSDRLLAAHVYFPEVATGNPVRAAYRRLSVTQIRDLRAAEESPKRGEIPSGPVADENAGPAREAPPDQAAGDVEQPASEAEPLDVTPGWLGHEVVFPGRDQFEPESAAVTAALDLEPLSPSLEEACQVAGADPLTVKYTYWTGRSAWILRTGQECVGVSAAGKVELPDIALAVFDLLDAAGDKPVEFKLPEADFGDIVPLAEGDGMYRIGQFAPVSHGEDLTRILNRARERNLRVGVTYYFFDEWYLEVFPPASEQPATEEEAPAAPA